VAAFNDAVWGRQYWRQPSFQAALRVARILENSRTCEKLGTAYSVPRRSLCADVDTAGASPSGLSSIFRPIHSARSVFPPIVARLWGRLPTCGPIVNRSLRALRGGASFSFIRRHSSRQPHPLSVQLRARNIRDHPTKGRPQPHQATTVVGCAQSAAPIAIKTRLQPAALPSRDRRKRFQPHRFRECRTG
jgi:hypothetical protein